MNFAILTLLIQCHQDSQGVSDEERDRKKLEIKASNSTSGGRDPDYENPDALARLMRDQLIMARLYANIAQGRGDFDLVTDLKVRIKEHTLTLGDVTSDNELPPR